MIGRLFVLSAVLLISTGVYAQTSLITYASSWKYLDNGTNQATAWRAVNFNDASWKTGTGKFGYGIAGAATNISYGTNAKKKYITTYFRKSFSIADPTVYNQYTINLKRDDGAVVYVNGVEVYRNNLPTTTIAYNTLATDATDNGTIPLSLTIPASSFTAGTNVVAVEVHQSSGNTNDMAFDLELNAAFISLPPPSGNGALVDFNSTWKYLDNGSNQGTAWRATSFNDVTWKTGNAKFGYGINDAATNISFGGNNNKKYITTYFRKSVNVQSPSFYNGLAGKIKRDDGVIVYINGTEVYRNNITTGSVSYTTQATEASDNGTVAQAFTVNSPGLVTGTNVIAVEIHQAKANTPDMAFDLQLLPAPPTVVSIKRQQPTNSVTNATSVTSRVIFSSPVTGVDVSDFLVTVLSGNFSSSIAPFAVTPVGSTGTTYDVTTSVIIGSGMIRLDLKNSGTGISNEAGIFMTTGFSSGETYTINQAAPVVTSIARQSPLSAITNANTVVYRVTFSQSVSGVNNTDFTLNILSGIVTGTIAPNVVPVAGSNGTTYDVTVSGITGNGDIRLDLNSSGTGIVNSLNTPIATGYTNGDIYTINQSGPAVLSINRQSPLSEITNASIVTLRIIFTEGVTGVDRNDFSVTVLSGNVTGTLATNAVTPVGSSGTTYDVAISNITNNGTLRLDLKNTGTGITNTLGTAITAGFTNGQTYTINQTAPTVVSIYRQTPASAITNTTQVTHRVTFSEAVNGVDENDFTLTIVSGTVTGTIATVVAVGSDGTTYDVTTSNISGNGVLRLDLKATGTGITNTIGTAIDAGFTNGEVYTINQTAPSVLSINRQTPASATTNASQVTHRVIFSEAVNGVDANDFTLAIVSGTVSGTIATVSAVDGTTYDVTTTNISGNGEIRLDLNNSGTGITNTLNTPIATGFTNGETYTINQTAPSVVSISRQVPSSALTNASEVTHRVIFSDEVTGVDKNDFTLTIVSGTVSGTVASVNAVGTDGTTYDVTTNNISGTGVIRLDLNNSGTGITNTFGTLIASGFTTGETYSINQTAPAVVSIVRNNPANASTNATQVTHRVTFSEIVNGVDINDFTLYTASGNVTGNIATVNAVNGTTYDVTTNNISGTGVIRLDLNNSGTGITNTLGTAIATGFTNGEPYSINQTVPSVLSINRQDPPSATTNATEVTHRVTFSEPVNGVDNTDFTLHIVSGTVSGTIGTVNAVGTLGTTYDVTTTNISGDGEIRLDLKNTGTGITNTLGTPIAAGFINGETYTINQTVPSVVSINRQEPASATTNATQVTYRITFSQTVTGVDNNDFTLHISGTVTGTIGTVNAVGTDGTTYDVTTTNISGNGDIRLDLKNSGTGITNTLGTAIAAGFTNGQTYTINQTAPAALSINRHNPIGVATNGNVVTHRVIFSEAVTGVDNNDFTLHIVSGTVTGTVSSVVAVNGTTYDVTTNNIAGNGEIRLDLNNSGTGITSTLGTPIAGGFNSGETYTINQTAPSVLSINRQTPASATTNASQVTHRVIFSEAMNGVDANDFTLAIVSGTVSGTIATVSAVDGTTYDVTTTNISGNGEIRLDLNNSGTGITNTLNTPIATGFTNGETYTINQTAPSVVSISRQVPSSALTNASEVTHRVIFSDEVTGVDKNDFTLTIVSGTVSGTVASVNAVGTDGTTYDVTTNNISGTGVIRLDLNNSGTGITNTFGTLIASGFTTGETYSINQTAPAVVSIVRNNPANASTNATQVTHRVTFSEIVNGVDINDFTLYTASGNVTGNIATVNAVNGTTYDVTTNNISGTGVIRLDLNNSGTGITNTLGTAIATGFTSGEPYSINQTVPSVLSINRQDPPSATTNATEVTHRVTFSEPVNGVDNTDFTLHIVSGTVSGTIGTVNAVGTLGTTYDVTTTNISGDGEIRLDLKNTGTGITNTLGTPIAAGFINGETYTINQTVPSVVSINRQEPASATTNATQVTYRITFSQTVTGVDNNDFTLHISGTVTGTIGTVNAVGTDGTTYDVTTTNISGNGDIRLDLKNSGTGITNTLGTAIAAGFTNGQTYTINQTAPAALSINRHNPIGVATNGNVVTHRVIFSEAVTGVDNNDFTLHIVSGTVTGTVSSVVAVNGTTYDVTTNNIAGNGEIRLDLNNSGTGITSTLGTPIAAGFNSGETYTISQTIPFVVSINRQVPPNVTTHATEVTFRVTFSEAVSGVNNYDFGVTTVSGTVTGIIGTVNPVGSDGTTYDVTASNISGAGEIRLDLNNSGTDIINTIGTAIATGFTSGETYTITPVASDQMFNYQSAWKYLDNGSNQGTAWVAPTFNDNSWSSGIGALGYGTQAGINTIVSYGPSSDNKFITTYFRKTINVPDISEFTGYTLNLKRDDGIVVYLNGQEVYRNNMPEGSISSSTRASSASDNGSTIFSVPLTPSQVIQGDNVIAVEIHQDAVTSSDIFFDMEMKGALNSVPTVLSINRKVPIGETVSSPEVTHRVSFSVPVIGVDKTDFSLTTISGNATGTIGADAVSKVGTDGKTYDVTTTNISGNGVIRVDLKNSGTGITNTSGLAIVAGFTSGEPYTISLVQKDHLFDYKSSWKYLDNGSDQGTAWTSPTFNDDNWSGGNGILGYGQGGEGTVVSFGPSPTNKHITTYFRKTINVPDISEFNGYTLKFRRDDGAVVYVNGQEVFRTNMIPDPVYTTLAFPQALDDGTTIFSVPLTISQIHLGDNVIAVEIHQYDKNSSDIVFDMELKAKLISNPPRLENGPYLNQATRNGIIIRWRTDSLTDTRVSYGTTLNNLTGSYVDNTLTREHIAEITGLTENTKYYYAVKEGNNLLQGDANNYFKTLPPVGSKQKVRVLVTGDVGTNAAAQANVRDAYRNYLGSNYTDVWMLLGDNAYNNGLDNEYKTNFFDVYEGSLTKNHVLWPAPGNHDYANSAARQADHQIPYFDLFSVPINAEVGGVASHNKAFYSYNYGNIHFVSLDSYGWEDGNAHTRLYDTTGAQATWLKQDLAANTQKWTVVYFHHPPYTKGSHNSDTEDELIDTRQKIVRILERYKVDLVLNGHSHSYERSLMINGHYGTETTFNPATMALSSTSGKYDGTTNSCVYVKKSTDVKNGIVYAVVGSSGMVNGSTPGYPHDAMQYSNITNSGALVFEIEDNRLDAKWVCDDGVMRDQFTIFKDAGRTIDTTIIAGSQLVLTASWQGTYQWSTGATTRSITVNPAANINYSVTDGAGCVTDIYHVTVTSAVGLANNRKLESASKEVNAINANTLTVTVAPNPSATQFYAQVQTSSTENVLVSVTDLFGRQVYVEKGAPKKTYTFGRNLSPGMYVLKIQQGNKVKTIKIIKQQF